MCLMVDRRKTERERERGNEGLSVVKAVSIRRKMKGENMGGEKRKLCVEETVHSDPDQL